MECVTIQGIQPFYASPFFWALLIVALALIYSIIRNILRPISKARELNNYTYKAAKARLERIWVEEDKRIHALNYWWHRYILRTFEKWLIKKYSGLI